MQDDLPNFLHRISAAGASSLVLTSRAFSRAPDFCPWVRTCRTCRSSSVERAAQFCAPVALPNELLPADKTVPASSGRITVHYPSRAGVQLRSARPAPGQWHAANRHGLARQWNAHHNVVGVVAYPPLRYRVPVVLFEEGGISYDLDAVTGPRFGGALPNSVRTGLACAHTVSACHRGGARNPPYPPTPSAPTPATG